MDNGTSNTEKVTRFLTSAVRNDPRCECPHVLSQHSDEDGGCYECGCPQFDGRGIECNLQSLHYQTLYETSYDL